MCHYMCARVRACSESLDGRVLLRSQTRRKLDVMEPHVCTHHRNRGDDGLIINTVGTVVICYNIVVYENSMLCTRVPMFARLLCALGCESECLHAECARTKSGGYCLGLQLVYIVLLCECCVVERACVLVVAVAALATL